MNYLPSIKFVESLSNGFSGDEVDQEEVDLEIDEYRKSAARVTVSSHAWEISQANDQELLGSKMNRIVAEARRADKSKLTPLGASGDGTKRGQ